MGMFRKPNGPRQPREMTVTTFKREIEDFAKGAVGEKRPFQVLRLVAANNAYVRW